MILYPAEILPQNAFEDTSAVYIKRINMQTYDIGQKSKTNGIADALPSWMGGVLNALHFETEQWVVENYLLFDVGDELNEEELEETARLLRQTGYFLDARVFIEKTDQQDSVVVRVVTKDRWTLTPDVSYNSQNEKGYALLKDDNFLGNGHEIKTGLTYDSDAEIGMGGVFEYQANNLMGTFVNALGIARSNKRTDFYGLSVFRPFVTDNIRWGGGIDYTLELGKQNYILREGISQELSYRSSVYDLWVGHIVESKFLNGLFGDNTRYSVAGRIGVEHITATDSIGNDIESNLFADNNYAIWSFGLINRKFYTDNYVSYFGKTEDITYGNYFTITMGHDVLAGSARLYGGIMGITSDRVPDLGYYSLLAELGGYRNDGRWEQNTLRVNLAAHSELKTYKKWKFRHFIQGDYLLGFNRFPGEQVYLNSESGLRGINGESLFGSKRLVVNLEERIYSPYSLLGFEIGALIFADFGMVAPHYKKTIDTKVYQGYGAGLRFVNSSIAQAGIEISAVYNPFIPEGSNFGVIFTGTIILDSRYFEVVRPEIIKFGEAD